jgi:Na/Pi-cotransporter
MFVPTRSTSGRKLRIVARLSCLRVDRPVPLRVERLFTALFPALLLFLPLSSAGATLPAGSGIFHAADTLGRDISGNGQTVKPVTAARKPLLVQVVDRNGVPVVGVEVRFTVEPGYDERGEPYANGGLVGLVTSRTREGEAREFIHQREAAEPASTVIVRTDAQGYAGVQYYAGRHVEAVAVAAALEAAPKAVVHFRLRIINPRWGLLLWSGLLGGLAIFLYGMRLTSTGLEQAAGHRLRGVLARVTDNRLLGLLTGIVVTALIQSSSATTVMVVSFTNAGLMSLGQTLAIILGADVGTTLTVQIIAFSLKEYSLLIIFLGFLIASLPRRRYRGVGRSVLGFGLIFFGMSLMGNAMDPLRDHSFFREMLLAGSERPVLVLLVATLFTGLIQSSAATIGIALTFAFQGLIDLRTAVPVILGANIGTCVTACLAAIGTRREAQRVAYAHILFKVFAVLLFLPFIGPFTRLVALTSSDLPRQIANAHTFFNVAACPCSSRRSGSYGGWCRTSRGSKPKPGLPSTSTTASSRRRCWPWPRSPARSRAWGIRSWACCGKGWIPSRIATRRGDGR